MHRALPLLTLMAWMLSTSSQGVLAAEPALPASSLEDAYRGAYGEDSIQGPFAASAETEVEPEYQSWRHSFRASLGFTDGFTVYLSHIVMLRKHVGIQSMLRYSQIELLQDQDRFALQQTEFGIETLLMWENRSRFQPYFSFGPGVEQWVLETPQLQGVTWSGLLNYRFGMMFRMTSAFLLDIGLHQSYYTHPPPSSLVNPDGELQYHRTIPWVNFVLRL